MNKWCCGNIDGNKENIIMNLEYIQFDKLKMKKNLKKSTNLQNALIAT